MRFFDSHAHLDDEKFDADRTAAIARAREAGVTRMVNVGTDAGSARLVRELAREHEGLFAAAAVHPSSVREEGEAGFAAVRALLEEGGFVAVGETGLDYHYDFTPPEEQRPAFRRHLALAAELDLPVIVHCREAHADCRRILAEEALRRDLAGRLVMHCFDGSADDARFYLELGAFLSFSGPLTFKNDRGLRATAAAVPLDRTLVETDCPYLAPQKRRGKRNEPAFVVWVAEEVARIHGVSVAEAARATAANACRLFGIGGEE